MNIKEIVFKDLRESLTNKTILIVILLPVIASLFFTLISQPQIEKSFQVGIIKREDGNLNDFINNRVKNFQAFYYENINKGIEDVENGDIDSFIVYRDNSSFNVYLDTGDPVRYFFLKDSIADIIKTYLNIKPEIEINYISISNSNLNTSFLPIWITITMTMIGILVISGNLAEEKEKRTLAALLISPVKESSIIIAKSIFGLVLSIITVLIMCVLNRVLPGDLLNLFYFILLILTASICFTSIGIIIGTLAETQSSARSVGTIIYFPLLFPALIYNLSDFSRKLARFFPTYYLYRGLEKVMYYNYQGLEIIVLSFFAVILFAVSYIIFKRMIRYNEL